MVIKPISGEFIIPGDKSISHRALILASQTIGQTTINNLSTGKDVLRTISTLKKLGIRIKNKDKQIYEVSGVGVGGLSAPNDILNMGNSGTSARLITGLISTYPFTTFITGDRSLRNRSMNHVTTALRKMCVDFMGEKMPLAIIGSGDTIPIEYELPISSAQLKSAILFAALNTQGISTIIEPMPFSRDHTEIMLKNLGANLKIEHNDDYKKITLEGQPELFSIGEMFVPSDTSSAAFLIAAAIIVPDSDILIKNVCINQTRIGFYEIARKMGANITFENNKTIMGEKVADIRAKYSKLKGIDIPSNKVPATIDEFPILSILAAYAQGVTKMSSLSELRNKESDRINAIVTGLKACGVNVSENNDRITIKGYENVTGGCKIKSFQDHRIAMSFMVCDLASEKAIKVDNISMIKSSFPEFLDFIKTQKNITEH
ncbi:MAG: 3-phosphoshikimate 1-carboxyvinyltransferase [Rickettsiaceae bacterium H1]|nr:3-phosphoshikimate 1-carboxyvinyltransferase [Rickettsiaceae bacterium H1]